jgi:hypothetical protein
MMCDMASTEITEQRLVRAYTRLFLVPKGEDGSRRVSLKRFGDYDVLIVEHAQGECVPRFWMELYAYDLDVALDSCACDDLEQATIAADGLIAQARRLYEESAKYGRCRH